LPILCLCLLEDQREVQALVGHLAQDVVAGPVDDAGERQDPVGDQAVLDGSDQWDATGHRGLEAERDAGAPRLLVELDAMVGQERLVPGTPCLAAGGAAGARGRARWGPATPELAVGVRRA